MFKRVAAIFGLFFFGALVFIVSVLRSAEARYVFTQSPSPSPDSPQAIKIDYQMPYPGRITPDSPLWSIKALRDKAWLAVNFSSQKKAEILLSNANKRIQMAKTLFEEDKADLAVSTITKAEKYLEESVMMEKKARSDGAGNADFNQSLALSILKHRQLLEEVLVIAPEDAKPAVVKALDYPKKLFEDVKHMIIEDGGTAPKNPYDSQ